MIAGSITLNNDTTVTQLSGQLFLIMEDGSRRLVAEGETLPQGAVVLSLDTTTFVANGQLFELVGVDGNVTENDASAQQNVADGAEAQHASPDTAFAELSDEIASLHDDILKGMDPTANFVATAAGGDVGGVVGASGSGNGGYVTIERDGDAVIATAGFDTSHPAEPPIPRAYPIPIDIDGLAEPEISVIAPDNTNDTTPTITGTTNVKPGSTITIVVTDSAGNKQDLVTTVKPDGSFSVDVTKPLPEGDYKVDASVTDPNGDTATDTDDGSIDLTPPHITVEAPDNTTDTTPTITGTTDAKPGSTVTIIVTDSKGNEQELTTTVKPDGSYSVDVEKPLPEGDYKAEASVTDPAGNTATDTDDGSVDLTKPEITVDAPDNTTDTTPTITGTTDAKPGSTVTIIVTDSKGNEQELTTTVKPDGSYSVDVEKPLPEGDYKAEASVTDPAGNTATDTDDGSVDLTAPQITVDAPDNTPDTTPTITGTTDVAPGSTVTIVVTDSKGNEQTLTTTVKPDGSYSVDVETPLTEGDYTADATVTDPAGNKGEATDPGSVDITPPDLGIALDPNITPDDIINAAEAKQQIPVSGKVSGEFNVGDTVTLTVNGKEFTGKVLDTEGNFTIDVPGSDLVADPDHTIDASVTSTDAAGNSNTATDTEGYGVDTALPDLGIELDPNITPDDIINAAEAGQQIPVSGIVSGEFHVGDTVTLTVNDKQFTGKVLDTEGHFTIDVPGSDLVADPDHTIDASITSTDAAGNSNTATDTEGYGVDTELPELGIALDPNITPDDIINAAEAGQQIPVSGVVSGEFNVGDTVTLTVNNKQFTGKVLDTEGHFTIDVPGSDLVADPDHIIDASITSTDAAGNSNTATDTEGYGVDTALPELGIELDPNITPDDIINAAEAGEQIPVSGIVKGEFNVGDTVTLTVNDKEFTGKVLDTEGHFTIDVPGSDLVADPDHTIDASITSTDAAGNSNTATDTEGYQVDTTLPVIDIELTADITSDDAISSFEAGIPIPITGVVTGDFKAGDNVTLTINDKEFSGPVDAEGKFSIMVPGSDLVENARAFDELGEKPTIQADITVTDDAGNSASATDTEDYHLNPYTPEVTIVLDPIAGDNVINETEAGQDIPVTGFVQDDYKAGDIVTLTVNGKTFTGPVDADGKFSIMVPGSDLVADGLGANDDGSGTKDDHIVDASIECHDPEGFPYGDTTTGHYEVDKVGPSVKVDIVDSSLNEGNTTSDVTFTFSEEVKGFDGSDLVVEGGKVTNLTTTDNIHWTGTFTA
ncbi:MAG: retention module-containing protein, partial [Aeromonas sp.]